MWARTPKFQAETPPRRRHQRATLSAASLSAAPAGPGGWVPEGLREHLPETNISTHMRNDTSFYKIFILKKITLYKFR